MDETPRPRYPNVAAIIGADAMRAREERLAIELDSVRQHPEGQRGYSTLAATYRVMALEAYALGYPIAYVAELLKKEAAARIHVFRLRGTQSYTRTSYPPKLGGVGITETLVDYGVGNSWFAFKAACDALAAGDFAAAGEIAGKIWDPPDADYIGRHSETCTPEQQKVAYAFRDVYLKRSPETAGDLPRISQLWRVRGLQKDVAYHAGILRAVLASDAKSAFDALTSLLNWHAHEARRDPRNSERDGFLYIQPIGIALFLISRGLLTIDQLPKNSVPFPIEMVRAALNPA